MNYKFHKPITLQIYGYLGLIPFFFALFPILESRDLKEVITYAVALLFFLTILILNHLSPMIRVTAEKLLLYNTFNNRPIVHLKKNISKVTKANRNLLLLTIGAETIELRLKNRQIDRLIKILEEPC